ncbi:hypothetical protein OG259_28670 [Streptomyces sp. NBC_00250]|uniref:hypothetical protein n=1 Tax=Streptomyces sp. NBC_00250 TaxID=2903641 RepID=UPI002E2DD26E|nr:hypothetical protein [Streptomyces sp. NBC_00250]
MEAAVHDASSEPEDDDAAAALRQQIKRALREDRELLLELTRLLPAVHAPMTVIASGQRAIAAQTITTAVTGDNATTQP